jgi:hypothetical protein
LEETIEARLVLTAVASLAELVLAGGQAVGLLSNGGDAAERYPAEWTGGSFRRLEDALEEAGARRRISAYRPLEVEPGLDTSEILRRALNPSLLPGPAAPFLGALASLGKWLLVPLILALVAAGLYAFGPVSRVGEAGQRSVGALAGVRGPGQP